MAYAVKSQNTLDKLSLHDCCCTRLYFDIDRLIMQMEWMEVLAAHPKNPFEKAHQSDAGIIELISPKIIEAKLYYIPSSGQQLKTETLSLPKIDLVGLEFLKYSELTVEKGYRAELFALFDHSSEYDSIDMTIAYTKSIVMWNALKGESWFEDERWKK